MIRLWPGTLVGERASSGADRAKNIGEGSEVSGKKNPGAKRSELVMYPFGSLHSSNFFSSSSPLRNLVSVIIMLYFVKSRDECVATRRWESRNVMALYKLLVVSLILSVKNTIWHGRNELWPCFLQHAQACFRYNRQYIITTGNFSSCFVSLSLDLRDKDKFMTTPTKQDSGTYKRWFLSFFDNEHAFLVIYIGASHHGWNN